MLACCKSLAADSLKHSVNIPTSKMPKFSTIKQACDFLSQVTNKRWEAKYEILHGKRFYFVWREIELPFNQKQLELYCRGHKETVLTKMQATANGLY